MAKLYFKYGAMGSSKTANALMTRYNYLEKNKHIKMLKPKSECRDGMMIIKSRIGLEAECEYVEDFLNNKENIKEYDAIIVDEAQFLSEAQVDEFAKIVDMYDIPVLCYGLRTDFQSHFFPGSKRLMELADNIEEIKAICWCGRKAIMNTRINENGTIVQTGEQVMLGGNDMYISLCRKHYVEGRTGK